MRRLGVGAALALLTVYLAWGSTYLAIRVMVEALPPFTFAGVRSVLAGLVLVLGSRALGARGATAGEWLRAARAGLLLSFGGHALDGFGRLEGGQSDGEAVECGLEAHAGHEVGDPGEGSARLGGQLAEGVGAEGTVQVTVEICEVHGLLGAGDCSGLLGQVSALSRSAPAPGPTCSSA